MVTLGFVLLVIAFVATIASIGTLLLGHGMGEKQGEGLTNVGYIATFVAMGALTLATALMVLAFFRVDFTFMYVAENHSPDVSSLSWLYKLSGLWAGREGSFLFWAWVLSLFASWVAYKRIEVTDRLSNMGLMVTNIVLALFTAGMMFSDANNPFKATPVELLDPTTHQLVGEAAQWGMNPLLQHWAMILHPPTLFIGYAGMTIPFAFAIAAIIVNDGSKKWIEIVDRITIFSWLFLGAGIGLGAVWAYVVLGWGGYWGWDPVENASLLPWLTGVGLLHSFTVYRKREGFKRWSIMMAAVTFMFVILGTFITRSGILADSSVHSFSPDNISLVLFLIMMVAAIAAGGFGLWWRGATFSGNDEFESLTSKEAAYYFNNVIMLVAGVVVAYLTLAAAWPKWMPLGGQSIPGTTFDAVARPVGILYLAILAVCPLLSWRGTDGATFWKRIKWPLGGTVVVFGLLLTEYIVNLRPIYYFMIKQSTLPGTKMASGGPAWYYETLAVLGLFVGSLLICTTLSLFIDGAIKRSKAREEGFGAALWSIVTKARSQSGGYLTHIGMGIVLIGLVGSAMFVMDQTFLVPNKPGSTFTVSNYKFTYQGTTDTTLANGNIVTRAKFDITDNGKPISGIAAGRTEFPTSPGKPRLDAAVMSQPLRDVFVVYQGDEQDGSLSVNVKINPLIWFSWAGFLLMLCGTALAAWPKGGGRELAAVSKSGSRAQPRPKAKK